MPPPDRLRQVRTAAQPRPPGTPRHTLLGPDGAVSAAAFGELVTAYRARVRAIAARLAPGFEDDACQEAFVKLWLAPAAFDRAADQARWVCQVARNACHDLRRRERAGRRPAAYAGWAARRRGLADERAALDRLLAEAADAARRLPRPYRAAVALALAGEPAGEAARTLGWTEGSYRARLGKARAVLAGRLADRDESAEPAPKTCPIRRHVG